MSCYRYIYDSEGEPHECPDLEEWSLFIESEALRRIALDHVGDVEISTVFLGVDLGPAVTGKGPPRPFETMIFGGELNETQHRSSTRTEALVAHKLCVDAARKAAR